MGQEVIQVEDLKISDDFIFVDENQEPELVQQCGICTNCCVSDCIGGN